MSKGKGYHEVYCVFYLAHIFNNRHGLEIGKYHSNSIVLDEVYFSHTTCLDQWHACK